MTHFSLQKNVGCSSVYVHVSFRKGTLCIGQHETGKLNLNFFNPRSTPSWHSGVIPALRLLAGPNNAQILFSKSTCPANVPACTYRNLNKYSSVQKQTGTKKDTAPECSCVVSFLVPVHNGIRTRPVNYITRSEILNMGCPEGRLCLIQMY